MHPEEPPKKKQMEHVPQDWLEEIGSFLFTCNNLVYSLWSQRCSRQHWNCAVSVSIWRKPLGHTNSTLVPSRRRSCGKPKWTHTSLIGKW
jgi:hypothetical protein